MDAYIVEITVRPRLRSTSRSWITRRAPTRSAWSISSERPDRFLVLLRCPPAPFGLRGVSVV